jgi:hypothetical protein
MNNKEFVYLLNNFLCGVDFCSNLFYFVMVEYVKKYVVYPDVSNLLKEKKQKV